MLSAGDSDSSRGFERNGDVTRTRKKAVFLPHPMKASIHVSLGDLSGNQVISDGVSNEFSIAVELEYLHNAVFVKGNCTSFDV